MVEGETWGVWIGGEDWSWVEASKLGEELDGVVRFFWGVGVEETWGSEHVDPMRGCCWWLLLEERGGGSWEG